MTTWRMSFRVGNQGHEMWLECFRLGVAAITYNPLAKTDLSKHPKGEPKDLWKQLKPTQKASLYRVAYEMKAGELSMKELVKAFNAEEIAEYLRLHPYTIRRLAGEKKTPAFRAGGQWRFRKDDIDQWSKSYPFVKRHPARSRNKYVL